MSAASAEPYEEMTLVEAVVRYDISSAQLQHLLRSAGAAGYTRKGLRAGEWRVTVEELESAGCHPRAGRVIDLRDEDMPRLITRLTAELQAERARANRLDGELGHAQLTLAGLRAQLRTAGLEPRSFGETISEDARGTQCPPSPQSPRR